MRASLISCACLALLACAPTASAPTDGGADAQPAADVAATDRAEPIADVMTGAPDASAMTDAGDASAMDASAMDASAMDASGGPDAGASIEALISRAQFDALFLHRATAPCRGAFYTYDAFVRAARSFPAFASEGTDEQRRREVAAFLANISHETTGGWPTAPDGAYAWGLCWIEEGGATPQTADYCAASAEFPCAPGQRYYGRGPMQLSWNYNYGQAGRALGLPLLANPALVATDPEVSFRTALWFWMTPQAPKPSCHAVMTGGYAPSAQDTSGNRLPGFGVTVLIINGGLECGMPTPPQVRDRLGFYDRYTRALGVSPGGNLECATMRPFGS